MKILVTTVRGLEKLFLNELSFLRMKNEILSYEYKRSRGRIFLDVKEEKIIDFLRDLLYKSRLIEHVYLIVLEKEIYDLSEIDFLIDNVFFDFLKKFLNKYTFYAVSSERIEKSWKITSLQLSKNIADIIDRRQKFFSLVSLDNPDIVIYAELDKLFLRLGFSLTFNFPLHRRRYRKYIHPSMLNPIIASALCYLAEVDKRIKILDPFCGSGTILIECKNINPKCFCYGYDIDPTHVNGARQNALEANIEDIYFGISDICEISYHEPVDAIITNPPFGIREKAIGGVYKVYKCLFNLAESVLKENGVFVLITPRRKIIKKLIEEYGKDFYLVKDIEIYEGGLSSTIYVFRKVL